MILTGKTEVLGEKHYTAWVVDGWMSMEQWWNDTDRGSGSMGRQTCPKRTMSTKKRRGSNQKLREEIGDLKGISAGERPEAAHLLRSWVRIPPGAWIFVCCECRVLFYLKINYKRR